MKAGQAKSYLEISQWPLECGASTKGPGKVGQLVSYE
jgi:hypothetical protein